MLEKKNPTTRKEELRSFAFLTVVMAPVLAGLIIAGYGFLVWIFQMFAVLRMPEAPHSMADELHIASLVSPTAHREAETAKAHRG